VPSVTVDNTTETVTVNTTAVTISSPTFTTQYPDPTTAAFLYSDFLGNCEPFDICYGTAGQPDTGTWSYQVNAITDFGSLQLLLPAAQGTRVGVFAADADGTDVDRNTQLGYGAFDFTARVKFVGTAEQTQRVIVGFGISHGPPDTTVGQKLMLQFGAAFVCYGGGGNWIATVADSNTLDEVDSGVAVDVYHTLRITTNASGTLINFYIDGNLIRSGAPTFDPSTTLGTWGAEARDKKTGGSTNAVTLSLDYMALKYTIAR